MKGLEPSTFCMAGRGDCLEASEEPFWRGVRQALVDEQVRLAAAAPRDQMRIADVR